MTWPWINRTNWTDGRKKKSSVPKPDTLIPLRAPDIFTSCHPLHPCSCFVGNFLPQHYLCFVTWILPRPNWILLFVLTRFKFDPCPGVLDQWDCQRTADAHSSLKPHASRYELWHVAKQSFSTVFTPLLSSDRGGGVGNDGNLVAGACRGAVQHQR